MVELVRSGENKSKPKRYCEMEGVQPNFAYDGKAYFCHPSKVPNRLNCCLVKPSDKDVGEWRKRKVEKAKARMMEKAKMDSARRF